MVFPHSISVRQKNKKADGTYKRIERGKRQALDEGNKLEQELHSVHLLMNIKTVIYTDLQ